MAEATIIGIDLAKRVFQVHGAAADGSIVFRRKLPRDGLLPFLAAQPRCVVAMEACATAHGWGREIEKLGHTVRLIAPIYVKPFVKRHKNDAADAEAITEAASRPTMRFVAVKTEAQQARAMLFRTRDLLVRQRTQLINALRGHLAEYGVVAPQGPAHLKPLADAIADEASRLPTAVRILGRLLLEQIGMLGPRIGELDKRLRAAAGQAEATRRLQTMPVWARSRRLPSRRSHRRWRPSVEGGTSRPGLGSCPSNARPAASNGSARHRRWANVTSAGCSSSVRWRWCGRPPVPCRRRARGSNACWRRSRGCWSRSHSPTRWHAASGRC